MDLTVERDLVRRTFLSKGLSVTHEQIEISSKKIKTIKDTFKNSGFLSEGTSESVIIGFLAGIKFMLGNEDISKEFLEYFRS